MSPTTGWWRIGGWVLLCRPPWGDVVHELGGTSWNSGDVFAGAVIMDVSTTGLGLCLTGLYRLAGLDGLGWLDGLLRGTYCDRRIGGRLAKVLRHRLTEPGGWFGVARADRCVATLVGRCRARQQRALRILIGLRLLRQIRRVERRLLLGRVGWERLDYGRWNPAGWRHRNRCSWLLLFVVLLVDGSLCLRLL